MNKEDKKEQGVIPWYYPLITEPKIPCRITQYKEGRFYESATQSDDTMPFPGVTSILKSFGDPNNTEGLLRWYGSQPSYQHGVDVMKAAGDIGHFVHSVIMQMFRGVEIDLTQRVIVDDDCNIVIESGAPLLSDGSETVRDDLYGTSVRKRLIEFMEWWGWLVSHSERVSVLASELMLYNNHINEQDDSIEYPYGGTCDLVIQVHYLRDMRTKSDPGAPNELVVENWLVDFKTGASLHSKDEVQQIAYKQLWDSLYGCDYGVIDRMFLLQLKSGWRRQPTQESMKKRMLSGEVCNADPQRWWRKLEDWYCEGPKCSPGKMPVHKKQDFPGKFSLSNNQMEGMNDDKNQ